MSAFAERINTGERNVYSIFGRRDISAEMLSAISEALSFNFFKLYERQLDYLTNDPEVGYQKKKPDISLTLTLAADLDSYYQHFSDFLNAVAVEAQKYGFKLK